MRENRWKKSLCFDDILLVPQESDVLSRHDVDLSMKIGPKHPIELSLPVIAAPMDTVCDVEMCIVMAKYGGMGILHRYMTYDAQIRKAEALAGIEINFGVAIASNNGYMEHAQKLYDIGTRVFLVDTANGHGEYAVQAVKALRDKFDDIHIMAGNVSTSDGFANLIWAGADSVRVGIGGGSACTTRIVSGHGMPTLASIMEIERWRDEHDFHDSCSIIADGGIRNSGDMVKSFAAGANAVMVGSMLAGTDQAPGDILTDANGREVKMFRGMASSSAQLDSSGKVSVSEGISTTIPYKGSVEHILDQIKGGLGSGCSYSGVHNLELLNIFAEYTRVSSASLDESRPHAL
jgi:IMP dehydrogenase